ncbi:MAG: hypothetical protein J6Z31_08865 [Fibrobacter sp.]|nr:hypothetical protein [Fibrobacter sp.]
MIRRILFLTCVVSAFAFASSESKDLAFRADKAVQAGKFAKANGLYERALLSSRKESDILSESRILISMATLRTQSLDLKFASDLLLQVRKADLDTNTLAAYYFAWMEVYLEKKNFDKVIELKYSMSEKFLERIPDALRGSILCTAAIAFAGKGDSKNAKKYLKDADDALDGDAPGKLSFAEARVASLLKRNSADSLYQVALQNSIEANRPFMSATILYYRGQNEKDPATAKDYFVRSANAFELMGLSRNQKRASQAAGR